MREKMREQSLNVFVAFIFCCLYILSKAFFSIFSSLVQAHVAIFTSPVTLSNNNPSLALFFVFCLYLSNAVREEKKRKFDWLLFSVF
ncbi:unnamed protein product [Meloidogyne enterolobii]|uniref:Uncharacterized protein n=3 Tax=Meloidogyne enterolobii TaxID=390850 RepID=A0ACB0YMM0_MELEN|nr:unnamed protein product [Meloidogyne enterolobii]